MLRQFNQQFFSEFVHKRDALVTDSDGRREVLARAKKIRSADYVFHFVFRNGVADPVSVVTRANWRFVLTNAVVFGPEFDVPLMPKVTVRFPYYTPSSPVDGPIEDLGTVPVNLVFGAEDKGVKNKRFEEYKNLFYVLDQNFVIEAVAKSQAGQALYSHYYLLLSGMEVDTTDEV